MRLPEPKRLVKRAEKIFLSPEQEGFGAPASVAGTGIAFL
jgi:hypothetical protein